MNSPVTIDDGEAVYREVEVVDPEPRALAVVPPQPVQTSVIVGGIAALARMSEESFDENIKALALVRDRVDQVKRALMKDNVDYGPPFEGSKKDTLLKPGAETLLRTFGLADSYRIERHVGDGDKTPDLEVVAYCEIHVGDTSGPVVAEGVGSANTFETKHRYRSASARLCPDCGMANVIKSKPPRKGWWCGTRDGGCGHSFEDGDKRIEDQQVGKSENPDPWDVANTVLKMAKKRSQVDAVLTATGASSLFTQDEDAPGGPADPHRPHGPRAAAQPVASAPAEGPKVPWSEGQHTIEGRLMLSAGPPSDGQLRTEETGAALGFRVDYPDGSTTRKVHVIARGALADDIFDACEGNLRQLLQKPVTVEGVLWKVPWDDANGRAMPPQSRLELSAIATEAWELPVPDVAGPLLPLDSAEVTEAVDA